MVVQSDFVPSILREGVPLVFVEGRNGVNLWWAPVAQIFSIIMFRSYEHITRHIVRKKKKLYSIQSQLTAVFRVHAYTT